MGYNYYIELHKNNTILGNVRYLTALSTSNIMRCLFFMFYNFNVRLGNNTLNNNEFTLAFFQGSGEELDKPTDNVRMHEDSLKYLKSAYKGVYAEDIPNDLEGYIGITTKDVFKNREECKHKVIIDLTKKEVKLDIFEKMTLEEYRIMMDIPKATFDKSKIQVVSFDPNCVVINELEDVQDFVSDNVFVDKYFMVEGDDETVYAII